MYNTRFLFKRELETCLRIKLSSRDVVKDQNRGFDKNYIKNI